MARAAFSQRGLHILPASAHEGGPKRGAHARLLRTLDRAPLEVDPSAALAAMRLLDWSDRRCRAR